MPEVHRKTRPGRFGTHPVFLTAVAPATLTGTGSDTLGAGGTSRQGYIDQINVSATTIPASAGTVTATVKKFDSVASATITLSAAFDLKSLTANVASVIPMLNTLSTDRVLRVGDTVFITIAASAAYGTQPVNLKFNAEIFVTE